MGDRKRPHHHRRIRVPDRSAAPAESARRRRVRARRVCIVHAHCRAHPAGARRRADACPDRRRRGGACLASIVIDVAPPFATGLHQVDNPVFDRDGNLYVTYSGTRGQQVPVSIFRVRPDGTRETFCTGLVNPTSMALGPGRPSLRVEPIRRDGVSRHGRRLDRAVCDRPRRAVRAGVRSPGHAVCRRPDRDDLPRRSRGAGGDACVGAVERGGVPPGVRSRRGALRHRADAVAVRFGVQGRQQRRRDDPLHRVRTAAGDRLRSARRSVCGGSARGGEWTLPAAGRERCQRCSRVDAGRPESRGRGVWFERARGRVLERHRVSVVTVRADVSREDTIPR